MEVRNSHPCSQSIPPATVNDLIKISGLMNFSKIAEKILGKFIISDMSTTRDPSQYGNDHYLIKMINEILVSVDRNNVSQKFAVFCSMIDWKQAFDRQCPTLGVQSFVRNGVRSSLIPLLISYFQDRRMIVKWHGQESTMRKLNGGGPRELSLASWSTCPRVTTTPLLSNRKKIQIYR